MGKDFRAAFYPNLYYHVFNHAVGREQLFLSAANYTYFLHLVRKHLSPGNRPALLLPSAQSFSFVASHKIRSPASAAHASPGLPKNRSRKTKTGFCLQQFSNCFNAYTKALNKQQGRMGKLFMEPFNRRVVDQPGYYTKLVHYIHANPVHHGFCEGVKEWPHSSYHALLQKASWLQHEEVMHWFGSMEGYIAFHRQPVVRKF